MVERANGKGPTRPKPLFWRLIGLAPARAAIVGVCRYMSWRVERNRGAPAATSTRGVVRLWRFERFREVSPRPDEPWPLAAGVVLRGDDPVLEMHIIADKLLTLLADGRRWRTVIDEEFRSLSPLLKAREEVAIVGSTILARQVAEFGAVVRPIPPGFHRSWDTFYRKLILLAFHPGGADRAARESPPVLEAAMARVEFCRRFR